MNKRPIPHQHRANATKVSTSRLTDKDSQPPVYQVGLGQRVYMLPGALWATLGHLPPIPQHPRTPGHKAFRSQLTANELGGIRFAGVGAKWSTVQPRSARANTLWQPRTLGIRGRYLPTKIPHLSGTPDAHGSDLSQTVELVISARQQTGTVWVNSSPKCTCLLTNVFCGIALKRDSTCHLSVYKLKFHTGIKTCTKWYTLRWKLWCW